VLLDFWSHFNVCDPSRFIFHADFVGLIRRRWDFVGEIKPRYDGSRWIFCLKLWTTRHKRSLIPAEHDVGRLLSVFWSCVQIRLILLCHGTAPKVFLKIFYYNPMSTLFTLLFANTATYTNCYKYHNIRCIHRHIQFRIYGVEYGAVYISSLLNPFTLK